MHDKPQTQRMTHENPHQRAGESADTAESPERSVAATGVPAGAARTWGKGAAGQEALLNDPRFLPAQRQAFVAQLGLTAGNRHLQRVVQRYRERLADREEDGHFTQTQTFEEFEAEVRRWVARRVLSRTGGAHRERTLVPSGALRGFYNARQPGQPLTMHAHFHSNGYRFTALTFEQEGAEIVIRFDEPEPSPDQPVRPHVVPEDVDPSRAADHQTYAQARDEVRDTLRDELISLVLSEVMLGVVLEFIGTILTSVRVAQGVLDMPTADERDNAKGFGAAVFAHRMAHYAFTHDDHAVIAAAQHCMAAYQGSPGERNRLIGQYMQDVLAMDGGRWADIRARIAQERTQPPQRASGRSFRSETELANYLVEQSRRAEFVSVGFWMGEYHQAWQSRRSFLLRR